MLSLSLDLAGFVKILAMSAALAFAIWMRQPSGILMWFVAAYYCWESHFHYTFGYKPYGRLGAQLRRATSRS